MFCNFWLLHTQYIVYSWSLYISVIWGVLIVFIFCNSAKLTRNWHFKIKVMSLISTLHYFGLCCVAPYCYIIMIRCSVPLWTGCRSLGIRWLRGHHLVVLGDGEGCPLHVGLFYRHNSHGVNPSLRSTFRAVRKLLELCNASDWDDWLTITEETKLPWETVWGE
jgi:hypothetical protein